MHGRWLVVTVLIVLILPLDACTLFRKRDVQLPVGACIREVAADGSSTRVPCSEPHTDKVIAVVPAGEPCPPESNMASTPAHVEAGSMTTCFAPDALGQ